MSLPRDAVRRPAPPTGVGATNDWYQNTPTCPSGYLISNDGTLRCFPISGQGSPVCPSGYSPNFGGNACVLGVTRIAANAVIAQLPPTITPVGQPGAHGCPAGYVWNGWTCALASTSGNQLFHGVRGVGVGAAPICPTGTTPQLSGGQYTGSCIVTNATTCPTGYQLDPAGSGFCNPVNAQGGGQVCPVGTTLAQVPGTGQNYCQGNVVAANPTTATCPTGYNLSSDQTQCIPAAILTPSCPANYQLDPAGSGYCTPYGAQGGGQVCQVGYTGAPPNCVIASIPSTPANAAAATNPNASLGPYLQCLSGGGTYNANTGVCTPAGQSALTDTSANPTINPATGAATCPSGMVLGSNGLCAAPGWTTTETVVTGGVVVALAAAAYKYRKALGWK